MAEMLKVIFDNPWNFFGTVLLLFVVGIVVNIWVQTLFFGKVIRWGAKQRQSK